MSFDEISKISQILFIASETAVLILDLNHDNGAPILVQQWPNEGKQMVEIIFDGSNVSSKVDLYNRRTKVGHEREI